MGIWASKQGLKRIRLGLRCLVGWARMKDIFGLGYFRVVRVPWPDIRITRNNFRYCGLEPELGFGFFGFGLGFFGFGFRVSGILTTHTSYYLDRKRVKWGSERWIWCRVASNTPISTARCRGRLCVRMKCVQASRNLCFREASETLALQSISSINLQQKKV